MKIGVIVAMEKELAQLRTVLDGEREVVRGRRTFVCGTIGGNEVVAQQCGIGKVNAAVGATELIDGFAPRVVVSTGVAGGADIRLNPLDVVVAAECAYHDVYCGSDNAYGQVQGLPPRFAASGRLVDTALGLDAGTKIVGGLTVSGDWFVDSREKMRQILSRFPDAMAVDMESCAIAQTCYVKGVDFVSLRIISDVPLKDTRAAMYHDFWNRMADGSFEVTRKFLEAI